MQNSKATKHRSFTEWPHAMPKVFALKIMKKAEILKLKQVEHIRNEKEILRAINHPFLVTLCVRPTAISPSMVQM